MKRIFSLIVLLAALTAQAQPLRQSTITTHSVGSVILGEEVAYNLYLPAGYDASSAELYPVIYLLHGLYGTHVDWATAGHMKDIVDELIANGELVPVVIVMPDAGDPDVHNNWNGYFNMPGHPYEDFFFGEFMPAVEREWKIAADKQHRAIMGLSMGGGGSTVYAQRHPDLFSSCYSMSGWLDADEPDARMPKDKLYIVTKSVHDHSAIDFVANADAQTLEQLRTVKWFFDCGDDDFILDLTLRMYQTMRDKRVPAELRVRDGWHSWEYWHTALRLSLPFASRNFGK
ncbi:MAG: esterase family protein [Bacteroidales bacterium]|nr:esterase family protein [Bacteroidales bacterium]